MSPHALACLSGERFTAVYQVRAAAAEIEARARAICVEQTVEFPPDFIDDPRIHQGIIGEIAEIQPVADGVFRVSIRYPVEAAGAELTQLLNVLFGNVSLQPGIRLLDIELPPVLLAHCSGPAFGQAGLRALARVDHGPLFCSALKPMGRSPRQLAELAYQLALGGIHLIKDDHGLADQPFCPAAERIPACAEAVARANRESGRAALYLPSVTAPAPAIADRVRLARSSGAGGLLLCPGLVGFDSLRTLAADGAIGLPIMSHPALLGSYCLHPDSGIAPDLLLGLLPRLAGADATIFPHWGGRFSFTPPECHAIQQMANRPLGQLPPIFPVPAGGIRIDRVAEVVDFYGPDIILLIGGDLHAQGGDVRAGCRRLLAQHLASGRSIGGC